MASGDDIKKRASRAVAWVGAASAIIAAVDAVSLVILTAFWVTKRDLGVATLATTLFYYSDLVTEQGLGAVLIQRETLDEEAASSIFWLNAIIATVAFGVLLVLAPLLGKVQDAPIVGQMLIVYGTKLFYQNLYFVPMAMLRRELRFKEISTIRTIANFGDVAAKIGFAAAGEPIWCFVAGPLARVFITGVGVQICRPWRPKLVLKLDEARAWLTFAGKTLGTWSVTHFYTMFSYQVVGYFFGDAALGVYRIAYELVTYPVNWISSVVQQVAYPAFAQLRHDKAALGAQFIRFSRQNLATVLPIVVVIVVGAPEIFAIAFPDMAEGANAARLLCIVGTLRAFDSLYVPLLDGLGWAGRNLMVAMIALVVLVGLDIGSAMIAPSLGYTAVVIGRCVGYPIVIGLHGYIVLSRLDLPVRRYGKELGGLIACALAACVPGLVIGQLATSLPTGLRLGLDVTASLLTMGFLLAMFEGISPRSILRELRK